MEIQVMMPLLAIDSSTTTPYGPYVSAPSSPQRFGNLFFSAPTSPTARAVENFHSTIPFTWEESPGVPKRGDDDDGEEDTDFAFDFSGQLELPSLSADELFDCGKIKPLKPPPRLQYTVGRIGEASSSPRSPKSPKQMFKEALSPRHNRKDFDPFSEAINQTTLEKTQRGREKTQSRYKVSRSLSPFRVSENIQKNCKESSSAWYGKWKLKDLSFLFRSASEGSATTKKEREMIKKSSNEDVKNSSFRSTDSNGSSVGGSTSSRRRRRVSAHELHYTANRAVAEEMRRKTFLPYKQGLLGCLGFHHGVHDVSRGIASVQRRE